jgi:pimeloyl-ACP methyl ester carboxylesterase
MTALGALSCARATGMPVPQRAPCAERPRTSRQVAMHIALEFPERVRSLVVVDIAPVHYTGMMMHETVLEGMASLDLDSISSTADARELLSPFVADAATREFVLTNLTQNPATKKYSWKVNLDALCNGIRNGSLASFPVVCPHPRRSAPTLAARAPPQPRERFPAGRRSPAHGTMARASLCAAGARHTSRTSTARARSSCSPTPSSPPSTARGPAPNSAPPPRARGTGC